MTDLMDNESLLADLSTSYKAFFDAQRRFFAPHTDRVTIIRSGLLQDHNDVSMYLIQFMSGDELGQLFDQILPYAVRMHRFTAVARKAILAMPKDVILGQIEQAVEPFLANGTYDEYRRTLELYQCLDLELLLRLANRAAGHSDPDIREAGEDFLNRQT